MISLRGVSKQFDGKRKVTALQNVDLDISRGHMISIVGPSGSGKSTLLNLRGGLDSPTTGEIELDGQILTGLGGTKLTLMRRDKIGFIFQFFNLMPTLSFVKPQANAKRRRPSDPFIPQGSLRRGHLIGSGSWLSFERVNFKNCSQDCYQDSQAAMIADQNWIVRTLCELSCQRRRSYAV